MLIIQDYDISKQSPLKMIKIGTLGPAGTSSEYAANRFCNNYFLNRGLKSELILFNTFEKAMDNLLKGTIDYVIAPHAYPGINNFYMRPDINLVELFRCDTPMYGLAIRPEFNFNPDLLEKEIIVSHPAPVNLVNYYLKRDVKIKMVNSTSVAAYEVKEGIYNMAITNALAKEKYNLKFVYEFKSIPMSWSVFERGDLNE